MASIEEILGDEKNEKASRKKNADEDDDEDAEHEDEEEDEKDGETEEDEDEVDDDEDDDEDDEDNDDDEDEDEGFLEWMKTKISKLKAPAPIRHIWSSSRWFKRKLSSFAWVVSTSAMVTVLPAMLLLQADGARLYEMKKMEEVSKNTLVGNVMNRGLVQVAPGPL